MKVNKIISVVALGAVLPLAACSSAGNGVKKEQKEVASKITTKAAKPPAPKKPATNPKKYPKPTKVAYLTFDDGPGDYTPQILKILNYNNVKATFFEIGRQVDPYQKYTKELINNGMSVQMHSWNHKYYYNMMSTNWVKNDLAVTGNEINRVTGKKPLCYRPPGGNTDLRVHEAMKALGYKQVMWDVDTVDWSRPGVNAIVNNAMTEVKNNSIILMHDGGGDRTESVKALPIIIDKLKTQGYELKELDCY